MPDHEDTSADQAEAEVGETGAPAVPPEQRGAADEGAMPEPEPGGERSGGAGSATGGVLESPGGPGTVDQRDEQDATLAEELVQEAEEAPGELSPDMGVTEADPSAGGSRFDQLVDKRKKQGLSDREAEELGELMAQRDGREWTSTQQLRSHPIDRA
jgi:hypothetical protein